MQYHNLHLKQNEHSHSLIWWLPFEESTLLFGLLCEAAGSDKEVKVHRGLLG